MAAYQKQFITAIKCNGKILREIGDSVFLPFGSEYSILLKNMGSIRAGVEVEIDGEPVTEGKRLILEPNSSTELEGSIINQKSLNKFKFIERTEDISNSREERIDDSFIRVKVFKEKEIELKEVHEHHYHHYYDYWRPYYVNPYAYPIGWPQYPTAWYSNTSGGSSLSCNANLSAQNI